MAESTLASPHEGAAWRVLGETIVLKIGGDQTDANTAILEEQTPAGGGMPLHIHGREDELFYVIEGRFRFVCGEQVSEVEPGTVLALPRGVPHEFMNIGNRPGRCLVVIHPAGFEQFLAEADALTARGAGDKKEVAALARRYDLAFLHQGGAVAD